MPARLVDQFAHWWETKIDPEPNSGCWIWTGYRNPKGYGVVGDYRRVTIASRKIYELLVGPIAPDLQTDHLCRNKACVNPNHLEIVTGAENTRRRIAARTRCQRGHVVTTENRRKNDGACLECVRAGMKAWIARHPYQPKPRHHRTHCKRGHEVSGDNLRLQNRGSYVERVCRACQSERRLALEKRRADRAVA